jgi:nicotinamidase-related amidase
MSRDTRDWSAFVLLLIDVQRDFWDEELAERFPKFPDNVRRLLNLCRTEGLEVVHLRAGFAPDGSDWMPVYRLRGHIPCVDGTPGVETLPFAVATPEEKVITKRTFDGFLQPELLTQLQAGGKRFVLTAGLVTSVCVFLTTASAMQWGYLAAIVEDCCADYDEKHEGTLEKYPFIFERTRVAQLAERHGEWREALQQLARRGDLAPAR